MLGEDQSVDTGGRAGRDVPGFLPRHRIVRGLRLWERLR